MATRRPGLTELTERWIGADALSATMCFASFE